ncbi:MAG: hypothetical protein GAK28_00599 [Luteibacter sp.]|uniref:transcriptional regulator n=1 Tax=Luteibacter sp. TaxID=1886636 RepID=UPI00138465E6|nr:helix-turn-helix domain-containing protein [Luteibacter sp.]KAF1008967.1 MAG: hypothetical protein GAK28_00599 [Luteibacter sp.]
MNPIERAIKLLGTQTALANAIGASPQQVQQWLAGTRPVPHERCPRIEVATEGQVRCEEIRADVDWLRDASGRATGYRVQLCSAAGKRGKKVGGDVAAAHSAQATRPVTTPKSPRVKGRQGEVAHG